MKVQIIGEGLTINQVSEKLCDVIGDTISRFADDNKSEVNVEGFGVVEAEFTVKFKVEGIDEPQVMTVEHHKGSPEMFTWVVDMDKDSAVSNEDNSIFDEFTVAKSQGQELNFKEVESLYNIIDLEEIPELTEEYSDMSKKVYVHKDAYRVVQVRQHRKLIQEYKLTPKELEEQAEVIEF